LVIIVAILEGSIIDASGFFSFCFDRSGDDAGSRLAFTSSMVLLLTCLALLTCFDLSMRLDTKLISRRFVRWHLRSLFLIAYTGLWWLGTYMSAHNVDMVINDRLCSRHGSLNGISGHLTFYLFWILTLGWFVQFNASTHVDWEHFFDPRLYLNALRSNTLLSVLAACYLVFVAVSLMVVSHTYLGGYHSLRQMLLGALLAVFSHWTLCNVFDHVLLAPREQRERVRSLLAALVGVYVAFSWMLEAFLLRYHPDRQSRLISLLEYLFLALCTVVAVGTYGSLRPPQQHAVKTSQGTK